MPSDEQMERLLALLNAHKQKTVPKKPRSKKANALEVAHECEALTPNPTDLGNSPKGYGGTTSPIAKKQTKKQIDAEKEKEIKNKVEQYLKPPAKKKSAEPAQASHEELPAPQEPPKMAAAPAPAPAPAPVPAPKVEVQNVQAIISEIQSTIQPSIDEFKIKQINSFIGSYRNRHI